MNTPEKPPPAAATMADWLDLHRLSPGLYHDIIAAAPAEDRISPPPFDSGGLESTPDAIWREIATCLRARLPFAVHEINETLATTRTDFAPDRMRYPRAFTLDAAAAPFASCPCDGQISYLLMLSHEFGHALQLVASKDRPLSPVARETSAYLCEQWHLDYLSIHWPELSVKAA